MVDQAEIYRKVASGNFGEHMEGVEQLCSNFADLPDKDKAWKDLIRLTEDGGRFMWWGVVDVLGIAFQHVPDKDKAWGDLHRLTEDEDIDVRRRAADALGTAFQHVPDKDEAWGDLHRLTEDEDSDVRWGATDALGSAFQHVPDKEEAWKDLHRLTGADRRWVVRCWHNIKYWLTWDGGRFVRGGATDSLGSAFQYIPDKDEAWKDLHRLTEDEDSFVRWRAAYALGSAFQYIPDKDEAWKDLHRLTGADRRWVVRCWHNIKNWLIWDEDNFVRRDAAYALGSAFQYIPDKDEAWKDLHRLTEDEDSDVRASANHAFGVASIFRATEAESEYDFESELKNAIEFFERSSKEKTDYNPSRFCLPFYRSFYTVMFEKEGAKEDVHRYLAEAKSASEGPKNKETLLEAVENLANALSEAHKITDFDTKKSELNSYRRYCDRAADLIGDAAEDAPGAARVLRRGLPIIGKRIRDIQEKAEALCRETRGTGTPYESLGRNVNKLARNLSDRDDPQNEQTVSRIIDTLIEFCNILPEGKRERPCRIVEEIREGGKLENKLNGIDRALLYLQPSIESQLQNAVQPTIDKTRPDERPSQNTSHSTTVIAKSGSTVVIPQTETESGDVTVNTAVTNESQPDKRQGNHQKRTAIEISADIAVHVLVYTILHHFAEDILPVIAPILVLSALTILLLIIRHAKSR